MDKVELFEWVEDQFLFKVEFVFKGEGELKFGKYCQFCKIKNVCCKCVEDNLVFVKMEFVDFVILDYEDIVEILFKLDLLVLWVNDVKVYVLKEVIEGYFILGYKLVEGCLVCKFLDEVVVS